MKKIVSAIFFISCTSIGAGILALPCLTVYNGFLYSSIIFIICYIFMTISSLLLLESTLWFKKHTSIISIVNQILGYKWKVIVSIIYILLLYSLISAYIIAYTKWITDDVINSLLTNLISILIYAMITFLITYFKNKTINKINTMLSIMLFITYTLIIINCFFFIKSENLIKTDITNINNLLTIALTSFGFGIIIPTLSDFFKKKYRELYKSILIGGAIPLILYIIWILVMIGIFPMEGDFSLKALNIHQISPDIIFTNFVKKIINSNIISILIKIFALLSIITSLIGVSASLKDFLSDERIFKKNNLIILIIIILPPIITIAYLNFGFIKILKISGMLVAFLLGIIPTLTVWHGRYHLKINSKTMIPGGKKLLAINYLFFIFAIINDMTL